MLRIFSRIQHKHKWVLWSTSGTLIGRTEKVKIFEEFRLSEKLILKNEATESIMLIK